MKGSACDRDKVLPGVLVGVAVGSGGHAYGGQAACQMILRYDDLHGV